MKRRTPRDVDDYIAGFPEDVREVLEKLRATIREAAPRAEEAIKYQIPTFTLNGNLVHFAAFARHVGFYPTPDAIVAFKDELSRYPSAKGSVQFPLDRPIPFGLVKRIVRFRVKQALQVPGAAGKQRSGKSRSDR